MTETTPRIPPPPEHWWQRMHLRHGKVNWLFIRLSYMSCILLAAMMLVVPFVGELMQPIHKWVGFVYIVIQLVAILSEDHLRGSGALKDHAFSLFPVLTGFGLSVLMLFSTTRSLSSTQWEVLNWWHACAWLDFGFGIAVNNTILNAPYQREEG